MALSYGVSGSMAGPKPYGGCAAGLLRECLPVARTRDDRSLVLGFRAAALTRPWRCAAGLLGEYLPVAWHERLLRAVCVGSAAGDAGELMQPLAEVSAGGGSSGRPEKRPKVRRV